jgi:glutamate racemase
MVRRTQLHPPTMTPTNPSNAPIGVFDSGIGGLSILKALRAQMPLERFVYFADSAHNPYGPKGDAFVIDRSRAITAQLIQDHGIKALVIACNTATAAAIHILRAEHPSLPIIGVEPALKPAVAASRTKRIAVFATAGTLQSAKFQALLASVQSQAEFVCTPCHGLADLIERSVDLDNTTDLIANIAMNACGSGLLYTPTGSIDTVVLGCTHYPLVLPLFRSAVGPGVTIVDNGLAVAKRVAQLISPSTATVIAQGVDTERLALLSSDPAPRLAAAAARWLV